MAPPLAGAWGETEPSLSCKGPLQRWCSIASAVPRTDRTPLAESFSIKTATSTAQLRPEARRVGAQYFTWCPPHSGNVGSDGLDIGVSAAPLTMQGSFDSAGLRFAYPAPLRMTAFE